MHLRASPHGEKRMTSKVHVFELIPSILLGTTRGMASIACKWEPQPLAWPSKPTLPNLHAIESCQHQKHRARPMLAVFQKSTHVLTRTIRQSSPCLLWATNPQSQNNIDTSASPNSVVNFTWGCMKSLHEQGPVRFDVHGIALNPMSVSGGHV